MKGFLCINCFEMFQSISETSAITTCEKKCKQCGCKLWSQEEIVDSFKALRFLNEWVDASFRENFLRKKK